MANITYNIQIAASSEVLLQLEKTISEAHRAFNDCVSIANEGEVPL